MLASITRVVLILLVTMLATTVAPASADAAIASTYKGWAHVHDECVGDWLGCGPAFRYRPAWQWANGGWQQVGNDLGIGWGWGGIVEGTRVYAWPTSWAGWHWAWTDKYGWALMRSTDIDP